MVMLPLDKILADARIRAELRKATNHQVDHYIIRAPTNGAFKDRLTAAREEAAVANAHLLNSNEGFEAIEPVWTGIGKYWYLRNQSSLGEAFPAGRKHYDTLAEALESAIIWWEESPFNREVAVPKERFDKARHANYGIRQAV
jgi:hypothetical protein